MLVEEGVRHRDGVCAQILLGNRKDVLAGRHRLCHAQSRVSFLYDAAGEKPDKLVLSVHNGESAKSEISVGNDFQNVADVHFGGNLNRLLNKAVYIIFNSRNLHELFLLAHIAMNQPETAVARHADGHLRFGDSIHIR